MLTFVRVAILINSIIIIIFTCQLNVFYTLPIDDQLNNNINYTTTVSNIINNYTNLTPNDSSFRKVIKTAQLIANQLIDQNKFYRVTYVYNVTFTTNLQEEKISENKLYQVTIKLNETQCVKRCADYTQCQLYVEVSLLFYLTNHIY